jgi:hypothetical protein
VNGRDPTGESCVSNEDQKGVTCQIDNPGELKGKDLDRANQVYTRAVNCLLVDPSREVKLQATDGDGNTVIAVGHAPTVGRSGATNWSAGRWLA